MTTETHGDHKAHKHSGVQLTGHVHVGDKMPSPNQPTDAKPFTDPVCGMKVGPNPEREITFGGEVYRFCSLKCMEKFRAAPESYLAAAKPADVRSTDAPTGTMYTCPMHPEIRQAVPGNCPICGMALEPELPSLDDEENPELVDFRRRFWWTLPLTAVVFALAMFGHVLFPAGVAGQNWIELALSTPVVLWAGWPFFVRWFQSLMRMSPNMWTLIGSGVMAAYGYSVVATLAPNAFPVTFASHGRIGVYFEAAAVIVSLTLLGQILELRARSQTSAAIKSLLGLAP
ncbi:YHS domain-containing protein, partial [Massilia aurea]|uniref:YHS domain-containing protein n=1 Tax=Massilia aurea TaxID=373040 RepID=UPI00351D7059